MWVASRGRKDGHGGPFYLMDGGWASDAERTAVWHANVQSDVTASVVHAVDLTRHQTFTYDSGHAGWGDGAIFRRHIESTGVHHLLLSLFPLDEHCMSGIGVHRRAARPPFADSERAIVHLVVGQTDLLHRAGTDVPGNSDALRSLSPRQREVPVRLLGLTRNTVNDHVKLIYQHLDVNTGGERMARFMPGR